MCKRGMNYLLENIDNDAIVRGLTKGTIFAHKTGSLIGIRHDGGIGFIDNKYIITVLAKDFFNEQDVNYLIGDISSIVYDIMIKTPPSPPEPEPDPRKKNLIKYPFIALLLFISLLFLLAKIYKLFKKIVILIII